MEFSLKRVLEFKIDDEEIDVFLELLETLKKKGRKMGFNKTFTKEQQDFIDALHYNLIGQHEEDTDSSDS